MVGECTTGPCRNDKLSAGPANGFRAPTVLGERKISNDGRHLGFHGS